jgi:hypothetical protein
VGLINTSVIDFHIFRWKREKKKNDEEIGVSSIQGEEW